MRWNWLTIVVLVLAVLFILHIYTSKMPFEQYLNFLDENMGENMGENVEGFESEKDDSDSESDSDSEKVEKFTLYDDYYYSPFCYGRGVNDCINDINCEWDDYNGFCRPRSYFYYPFNNWYNWYNDYWSPGRWWWPLYGGSYYPRYRRWRRHSRRHHPRNGGRGWRRGGSGMRSGGPRAMGSGMRRGGTGGYRRSGARFGGGIPARSGRSGGGGRRR